MKASYQLVSLWEMLQLPIAELLLGAQHTASLWVVIDSVHKQGGTYARTPDNYVELLGTFQSFANAAHDAGLLLTEGIIRELLAEFEKSPLEDGVRAVHGNLLWHVKTYLEGIGTVYRREAALKIYLTIGPELAEFFEPKSPLFGNEVASKFPRLDYEIRESGKCLAIGRSTASAFHSIRCLEAGIAALSRCLQIPDPTKGSQRNWQFALGEIEKKIDAKWPTAATKFSGDGALFESIFGALKAIQNPYRNATMHLDGVYTEQDAKHILGMVGGFMRKIASRMDENGEPKV